MIFKKLKRLLQWIKNRLFRNSLDEGNVTCPVCCNRLDLFATFNDKIKYFTCKACKVMYVCDKTVFGWKLDDQPVLNDSHFKLLSICHKLQEERRSK